MWNVSFYKDLEQWEQIKKHKEKEAKFTQTGLTLQTYFHSSL